ncbi:MAG: peptide deformylase [Desulfobacteraceae bacterium]
MAVLPIVKYPEKSLLKPSAPVETIDETIETLIENMGETMFDAPGVGLAAPQVGAGIRIIVYDPDAELKEKDEDSAKRFNALINPEIIHAEGSLVSEDEACLSVPDYSADVKRYAKVTVTALNREGKKVTFDAQGIQAVIMQHEIDHLDGILFIDRISSLKRNMYKKKMAKLHTTK